MNSKNHPHSAAAAAAAVAAVEGSSGGDGGDRIDVGVGMDGLPDLSSSSEHDAEQTEGRDHLRPPLTKVPVSSATRISPPVEYGPIMFGGCNRQNSPQDHWARITNLIHPNPDLFVWTGDAVYALDNSLAGKK